ncbi:Uncharacterised protein [Mycobacteroides abscessus]|nr:Uncharacterised protein [Mycobacteroides abscessus]
MPEVSTSTVTVVPDNRTSTEAVGLKPSPAGVSQANDVTAASWPSSPASPMPESRAATFCRSPRP